MKYGFSFTADEDFTQPLCVVCGEMLSNGSMKPYLLMCHLETKHTTYKQTQNLICGMSNDAYYFQRLSSGPNVTSYVFSTNKNNENDIEASHRRRCHVAKSGKNHIIAESFMDLCIKDAVHCM